MNQFFRKRRIRGALVFLVFAFQSAVTETALAANYVFSSWECAAINSIQAEFIKRTGSGIANTNPQPLFVTCPLALDWDVVENIRSTTGSASFEINILSSTPGGNPSEFTTVCYPRIRRLVEMSPSDFQLFQFSSLSIPNSISLSSSFRVRKYGAFEIPSIMFPGAGEDLLVSMQLLCLLSDKDTIISYELKVS